MEVRKQMGNTAENIALEYLTKQGFRLIKRNFTCKAGEIDLILQKDNLLVFAEVRSRSGTQYGEPSETVNRKKQEKIKKTAKYYLYCNPHFEKYYCRFDVLSIVWNDGKPTIEWIPDAFM